MTADTAFSRVGDRWRMMLDILRANGGFTHPEKWVDYALRRGFKRVESTPRKICPDCGEQPIRQLGQYIYYSTLIRLLECGGCSLIWADTQLSPAIIEQHFGHAYKDEDYFATARRPIFEHLAI